MLLRLSLPSQDGRGSLFPSFPLDTVKRGGRATPRRLSLSATILVILFLSGGRSGVGEGDGSSNRRAAVHRFVGNFLDLGFATRRPSAGVLGLAHRLSSVELLLPEVMVRFVDK